MKKNTIKDTMRKRAVRRPLGGRRDIHVTRKANFQGLKSKIITLIREAPDVVQLHALGAAITRCCDIALAVKEQCHDHIEIHIQTATVTVTDDFEPNVEVCKCQFESSPLYVCTDCDLTRKRNICLVVYYLVVIVFYFIKKT